MNGNCKAASVPVQDPFLEFSAETVSVPSSPVTSSSPWPVTERLVRPSTHGIDATSRVVSFVLGFALASVFAWLATISPGDQATEVRGASAAPKVESVAPAVEPVVAAATVVTPAVPEAPPPAKTVAPPAKEAAPANSVPPVNAAAPSRPVNPPPPQKRQQAAPSGYRGALVLNSIPSGADVVINGRVMGQTPIVLENQPAGSRGLVLRREGYAPWSASIRVVADQRTTVRATLTATRP